MIIPALCVNAVQSSRRHTAPCRAETEVRSVVKRIVGEQLNREETVDVGMSTGKIRLSGFTIFEVPVFTTRYCSYKSLSSYPSKWSPVHPTLMLVRWILAWWYDSSVCSPGL
jgi:hypothetical protein